MKTSSAAVAISIHRTSPWSRLPLWPRLQIFRLLEVLGSLRQSTKATKLSNPTGSASRSPRSLWVFVSTIGELNAIEPFLNRLLDELGHPPLVLITDRHNYRDAYLAKYPHAAVEMQAFSWPEVQGLVERRPPLLLLVAEIPGLLHDAPCRFSYAAIHAARRAGAPSVLVNGWLYGYQPTCRLDLIENRLFAGDYASAFDLMLVQTDVVRDRLLAANVDPQRVVVTGNIKFDAMLDNYAPPSSSPLRDALHRRGPAPVIVAGSISDGKALRAVLDGFRMVLTRWPESLLILAPRHPENISGMAQLQTLLKETGFEHRLRSQSDPSTSVEGPVLVLDTMGELRACYADATLAYVANDHNVLEPLACGKPVFVSKGWEPTYPSYPVYEQLLHAGVLYSVDSDDGMGTAWINYLDAAENAGGRAHPDIGAVLSRAFGAVERSLAALRSSEVLLELMPTTAKTL